MAAAHQIATLSLVLDRVQYVAGDIVRGSVRITAKQRFECTTILVVATGLETVNWNHDPEPGLFRTQQNVCYKQEIMVSPAERVFEPGEHACNFECTLPLVLPGSFVLPASYDPQAFVKYTSASIEYKFEANMEFLAFADAPGADARRGRHLHTSQGFIVHETHPELVALPRMDEIVGAPVGTCWLFRGRCDVRARIERDVFCQGDRVEVVCDFANDSSWTIPAVTCRLVQLITLRLRDHEHVEERDVGAWIFGPVLARERISRPFVFKIEATGGTLHDVLASPSTTNGTVVKCHYVIQVEAFVPKGGDLELRLPITVQSLLHLARDSSL